MEENENKATHSLLTHTPHIRWWVISAWPLDLDMYFTESSHSVSEREEMASDANGMTWCMSSLTCEHSQGQTRPAAKTTVCLTSSNVQLSYKPLRNTHTHTHTHETISSTIEDFFTILQVKSSTHTYKCGWPTCTVYVLQKLGAITHTQRQLSTAPIHVRASLTTSHTAAITQIPYSCVIRCMRL